METNYSNLWPTHNINPLPPETANIMDAAFSFSSGFRQSESSIYLYIFALPQTPTINLQATPDLYFERIYCRACCRCKERIFVCKKCGRGEAVGEGASGETNLVLSLPSIQLYILALPQISAFIINLQAIPDPYFE